MADPRYAIDWAPPDVGPGASFIASILNQNRAHDRGDAHLAFQREAHRESMERVSNEEKRKADAEAYRRSVEAFNARPMLDRMARRSVTGANANPYGVRYEEGFDLPANVEGPELSPAAEAARHAPKSQEFHVPEQPPRGTLTAMEEGPELNPAASAARYLLEGPQEAPRVLDPGEEGPQQEQPRELPIQARAAAASMGMPMEPGPQGQRRVYGMADGQRYEVPEQSDTSGFGEKYDAIYQRALQEPGVTPEEAYRFVAKMAHDDAAEAGKNQRLKDSIGGRDESREEHETFLREMAEKYRLTAEEQARLRREGFAAQRAAAGAAPTSPVVPELIRMTEEGAPSSEVYARAAEAKVSPKQFQTPIQNVVKNAATAERAGDKRAGLEVTDETGKVLGMAHNTTQANTLKKQIDQFGQAKVRLHELIQDIESQGSRVLTPEAIQQRLSKAESVNAAMRVYNGLGATDASQQLEARITGAIGTPGHGFLMGANADIIKRILHEAETQHHTRLNTALRAGGGRQLAPSLGGPRGVTQGGDMVTIRNAKTGETKKVTREEARRMGALRE